MVNRIGMSNVIVNNCWTCSCKNKMNSPKITKCRDCGVERDVPKVAINGVPVTPESAQKEKAYFGSPVQETDAEQHKMDIAQSTLKRN